MAITAKEIVIILLGITGSVILGLLLKDINLETKLTNYLTIGIIIFAIVSAIIFVFYKKFAEINKELEDQKLEQQKLNEKLKIYERLSKIEKKIFNNGN